MSAATAARVPSATPGPAATHGPTGPAARPVGEERARRRQRLAASFRLFARREFDEGAGGHMTARDPEHPELFWINPLGRHFGSIRASDLLLVDESGTAVEGCGSVNPAGFAIHSAIHRARPDVVAAVHLHSTAGRAFSTRHELLAPITQDACAFFEDHALHRDFSGVALDPAEGAAIAADLGAAKAVILANHGLLTVGGSVAEAAWWFITMDRSCQIELLARAAGEPREIPPEVARRTREVMGSSETARLNFKPLFEDIVRHERDLAE